MVLSDGILVFGDMDSNLTAVNLDKLTFADNTDIERQALAWQPVKLESEKPQSGIFAMFSTVSIEAIYGTPALEGELAIVGTYIRSGSKESGKIYAYTVEKGEQRWVYPRVGTLTGGIVGGITVYQGRVYAATTAGTVIVLDAVSGEKKWEVAVGGQLWSTPVISDDLLVIGSFDRRLYAIDAETGTKIWSFETDGPIVTTPVVSSANIFFGTYNRNFYAVDLKTGAKKWDFSQASAKGFWASPLVKDSTVYAPCLDGSIYVLDVATGKEVVPAIKLEKFVTSAPVLVDNVIYIVTSGGRIYTIKTTNNQLDAIKELKETVHAPLFTDGSFIYVHTQIPDKLYKLNLQGGTLGRVPLRVK